jgi:hypothetical protein
MDRDIVLSKVSLPDALDSIDSRLKFIEALSVQHLLQIRQQEREPMKSYHWLTVVVVLFVVYLVGVKYPSIGATALSKVGLA